MNSNSLRILLIQAFCSIVDCYSCYGRRSFINNREPEQKRIQVHFTRCPSDLKMQVRRLGTPRIAAIGNQTSFFNREQSDWDFQEGAPPVCFILLLFDVLFPQWEELTKSTIQAGIPIRMID